MMKPVTSCLELLMHEMPWVFFLALDKAGSSIAARMAMIAITTRSSIKVNALILVQELHPAVKDEIVHGLNWRDVEVADMIKT